LGAWYDPRHGQYVAEEIVISKGKQFTTTVSRLQEVGQGNLGEAWGSLLAAVRRPGDSFFIINLKIHFLQDSYNIAS